MTSEDRYREWDASYVLGVLDPEERREFERHLAVCAECRSAVTEMAGMPGLLGAVPFEQAVSTTADAGEGRGNGDGDTEPGGQHGAPGTPVPPLSRVADAARRRRSRVRALFATVAAGVVLVAGAGGWAVGRAASLAGPGSTDTPQATSAPASVELLPTGQTEIRASLVITPTAWGTRFDWSCDYPVAEEDGDGRGWQEEDVYTLVLVDDDGQRSVAATWSWTDSETSTGLGASSALPLERIDSVEIGLEGADYTLASGQV
ncbi:zf-HC2 domain-containing protein [Nocardiopsis exhalans]|uniref:Zf-HC2 domain-containing protein n=1 Tax=Nocardiopsis exhalans TaxID=163604 RepID=A0ABY5D2U2_9ACTN|nr:zf-HC2 domain-containing protein [Nocardiopsis exhalans]USY17502.1 zf-HC2 domain-containing protein [Nocardiopsis exhalans]